MEPLDDPFVIEDPGLQKYIFEGDSDEELEELTCRKNASDPSKLSINGMF